MLIYNRRFMTFSLPLAVERRIRYVIWTRIDFPETQKQAGRVIHSGRFVFSVYQREIRTEFRTKRIDALSRTGMQIEDATYHSSVVAKSSTLPPWIMEKQFQLLTFQR